MNCFCCDVPKEKRRKLDNKVEKCIFIGYKDGMKGYKIWNHVTKKTFQIRDVVFRDAKGVPRQEVTKMEKELEKLKFVL